jgi:hypothetical protein
VSKPAPPTPDIAESTDAFTFAAAPLSTVKKSAAKAPAKAVSALKQQLQSPGTSMRHSAIMKQTARRRRKQQQQSSAVKQLSLSFAQGGSSSSGSSGSVEPIVLVSEKQAQGIAATTIQVLVLISPRTYNILYLFDARVFSTLTCHVRGMHELFMNIFGCAHSWQREGR